MLPFLYIHLHLCFCVFLCCSKQKANPYFYCMCILLSSCRQLWTHNSSQLSLKHCPKCHVAKRKDDSMISQKAVNTNAAIMWGRITSFFTNCQNSCQNLLSLIIEKKTWSIQERRGAGQALFSLNTSMFWHGQTACVCVCVYVSCSVWLQFSWRKQVESFLCFKKSGFCFSSNIHKQMAFYDTAYAAWDWF